MKQIILFLILVITLGACADETSIDNEIVNNDNSTNYSKEQLELYDLIMTYRKENNLPLIPLSKSLSFVAQTHVVDLEDNQPVGGNCNLHSWSDKGKWTPVCYTSDHKEARKMWSKPSELTSYTGYGYEISFGASGYKASPLGALNAWKRSPGHNNLILNKGTWTEKWGAIGVGIYGGYAVVWFGREEDK